MNLPEDLRVEPLLEWLANRSTTISFGGTHKRNAHKDLIECEEVPDKGLQILLGRNSLYHSLPEYFFHTIGRFDGLLSSGKKDEFAQEYAAQEQEKAKALQYFAPVDLRLLDLRRTIWEDSVHMAGHNSVLEGMLSDDWPQSWRKNGMISMAIHFLPDAWRIRGDRFLLTWMLRFILSEDGIQIQEETQQEDFTEQKTEYTDYLSDESLGDTFLGIGYRDWIHRYTLSFWPEVGEKESFPHYLEELEEFRSFMEEYFLSVEEGLSFRIQTDADSVRLSDTIIYNYLNYNTNL